MQFHYLETSAEVDKALSGLFCYPVWYIDIETTGLSWRKDKIIDIQIAGNPETVYMFGGQHLDTLKANLPCHKTLLVGHNLKFDLKMLYGHGVDLTNQPWRDTMLLHHLLDENAPHDLDSLIKNYWNDSYKENFWSKYKAYIDAPITERADYACRDVYYTGLLYSRLLSELKNDDIPTSLIEHTHKLAAQLLKTEVQGLKVNIPYLIEKGTELKTKIELLKPELRKSAETEITLIELDAYSSALGLRKTDKGKANVPYPEFSFDSPKQLLTLLYGHLGLPPQLNQSTKKPSTDDASLEALKDTHPIIIKLQEYRALQKVYGAYIEGTLERAEEDTIYPEFNVNGTKTGRISSSNPNLQQLPRSGGIRSIYIPSPGHVFISADFSQLEVVIEANLTKDQNLTRVITEGISKHDLTAQELGVDRHTAKTLNFALQYFCSAWKISKLLKIPQKEADKIYEKYWGVYSGSRDLKQRTDKLVKNQGYVVNLSGRKRRFPRTSNESELAGFCRQAYNFLIQGVGADITNKAFYEVSQWLDENKYGRGVLTIHDEILLEVKKEYAEVVDKRLNKIMVEQGNYYGFKIPLSAESSGGMSSWED